MAPVVLAMDVHCDSCAKKIRKAVMKVPGAESVTASYETGLVMVHGTADAAALVARLQAKTKKAITIVSDGAEENGEAAASAGAGGSAYAGSPPPPPTIPLEMELHCGSCAEKVERRVMEIPGVDTVTTDVPGRRVTVTGTADASAVATSLEVRMRRPVIVLSDPRRPDDAVPGYDHEQRKAAAAGAAAQQMWEMYGSTSTAHVAPQETATDAASILSSLSSSSSSAPPPPPPAGGRRRRGRACHRAPSPPPVQGAGSSSSMTPSFPPPPAPSYGAPPPPPGYGYYYPAPPPPGVYDGQNWAAPAPPPSGCFLMQQGGEMYGQQWPAYPPPAPEPPEGYYPYGGQQYCDNPGSCSIQ
ncbi:unnamed protein product [Urochloa decumbens]|uniref:HMA domain-containing protein n=1 Tax=Urochloa decumbens TaxID=240449 RepID=A0ABC8YJP3_9POAL